ncbi:hypothetical protein PPOLYM_01678 [Paenibacillus polymyxa]|uniref:DUF4062 domain-containing protein n=1 Tax=Paenibacillus polymyxa TaxID=1406 RepID=UPI00094749A2|nr:DUF4062 domain-containing protein [Paenibacillus polymyxa]APQ60464.1 hypothetical protein VK72_17895 [Paenibacillus polymyxa]VUG05298.1 hypothetical protein PPOLYM_01678 [Paenibacillus polymyxa]
MKKKLQVFISSTYIDMKEERQAAVTAVLNAGHIPAGMELFKSGDQSQKETIKRWIDESDVYMLILGSRYGSIDPESGKSYTHWEYDYAGEQGKRRFAIVIDEKTSIEKAKIDPNFLERENFQKYNTFRSQVLGNISKFYEDIKDIRLITMESLRECENDKLLSGWIKASDPSSNEKVLLENTRLLKANDKLKQENQKLKNQMESNNRIGSHPYKEIVTVLKSSKLEVPKNFTNFSDFTDILSFFLGIQSALATGFATRFEKGSEAAFVIQNVIPKLMSFELVEKVRIPGTSFDKLQTSREGRKFLAMHEIENIKITS